LSLKRDYTLLTYVARYTVTGQLADVPTRGLVISRTGQLADWTSRAVDNSRIHRQQ